MKHYKSLPYLCSAVTAVCLLLIGCEKKEATPTPDPEPKPQEVNATLDRFYDGLYFGNFWDEGYANYYFVLTSCETGYSDGSYVLPAEVGGYIFYFDLWSAISEDHTSPVVPEGTYTAHTGRANGTFDLEHTLVTFNEEKVGDKFKIYDILFKDGTITVTHTDKGYLVKASMITTDDRKMDFTYEGEMTLQDKSNDEKPEDNVIRQDLTLDLKRVTQQQYDEGNSEVETYILRCFDVERITDNGLNPYGAGTKLQLGLYTANGKGLAGHYTVGERQDYQPGTFYKGSWLGLQAAGSFCMQTDEKNNAKYCLISEGTVDITDNGDGTYSVRCTLKDENGYHVECDWTGEIEEYKVTESVQTTLTEDVVFNPEECTEIYYLGDYYLTGTSSYNISLADEDEILSIDICASTGDSSELPTGKYTVSSSHEGETVNPGRVTLTYAEPTVYVKYNISGEEADAKDMAPVYSGTLTIEKSGSEYTISYEFFDDFNRNDKNLTPHKISGSWKGQIPEIQDYFEGGYSAKRQKFSYVR